MVMFCKAPAVRSAQTHGILDSPSRGLLPLLPCYVSRGAGNGLDRLCSTHVSTGTTSLSKEDARSCTHRQPHDSTHGQVHDSNIKQNVRPAI